MEIYPRLLRGPVVKSSLTGRTDYPAAEYRDLDDELRALAGAGEDAFDAAVSALIMAQHVDRLASLPPAPGRPAVLEGLI